jgi:RNA polymerase sigma factor (sigma-70 family)
MSLHAANRLLSPECQKLERELAQQYAGLRLLLTRRCGGNRELAADILQSAILTAWEKWQGGQIAQPELIAGYVFQTAINLLRNQVRSAAQRLNRSLEPAALDELPRDADDADSAVERDLAARVRSMLESIDNERDRVALKRFYLDEDDKHTICTDLGLSAVQFDKVLHRARGRLRALFEAKGFGPRDLFSFALL